MDLYEKLKNKNTFFLIAGPCLIESEGITCRVAEFLKEETSKRDITLIFKSSYKKANRTSVSSPSGPGLRKGLNILQKIKNEFELPILTDVHETLEVEEVSEVADIIQIPAFLSRQTELIIATAKTQRIVNIKKGQFMAPEDMKSAADKVLFAGNDKILLTERGSSFGYFNLVVDFRSFKIMNEFGFPVVYDVTHSLQKPSIGKTTGGTPEFAPMMAKAALATGMVNGLFIETHPQPEKALSDAATQLQLHSLPQLLDQCLAVKQAVNISIK